MSTEHLTDHDLQLLDRFLDGALEGMALKSCRERLERDPGFRRGLAQRKELRRGFAAGRDKAFAPQAGFAANVVAAARRLPVVDGEAEASRTAVLCRRILIAAAIVFAATILWHSELFHDGGDGTLQASPEEVQGAIEAIDARIPGGATGTERR